MNLSKHLLLLSVAAVAMGCGQTPLDPTSTDKSSANTPGGNGPTNVIDPPTSVSALVMSTSEVKVEWTNPNISDAFSIVIEYKKSTDSSYAASAEVADESVHLLTGLASNTTYDIRLQTKLLDGSASAYSNVVQAKTKIQPTALAVPTSVIVSGGELPVKWTYLKQYGANAKQFEVRYHLLDFNSHEIGSGTFQMVTYVNTSESYQTNRNLFGTGCGDNDQAEEITFDVRVIPTDLSVNISSDWAAAGGWINCPIVK